MALDRRKVPAHLCSGISANGRFADAKIEAHHRGDHGDMSRTVLSAGLALGEVDNRLPPMLAALLAEDTRPEMLCRMLVPFLEIQPASSALAAAPVAASAKVSEPPALVSESVSAHNLANSLSD